MINFPMAESAAAGNRRLGTVMFLDMVGYSKLMARDEARALAAIHKLEEIVREQVPASGGQLVKFLGDGTLAVFPTAGGAVLCSQKLLEELQTRAAGLPKEDGFQVRIGLHMGEIVEEGGDVFGDSVNIAARIQPLADPGGIAMSEMVFAQVRNQIRLRGARRRPVRLKNIPERIPVFLVAPPDVSFTFWYLRKHRGGASAGVFALLLAAGGLAAWLLPMRALLRFDVTAEDFEDMENLRDYMSDDWQISYNPVPGQKGRGLEATFAGLPNGFWGIALDTRRVLNGDWSRLGGLRFWVRSPTKTKIRLSLVEQGTAATSEGEWWGVDIEPRETWTSISVPFSAFTKREDFQPPTQDNNGRLDLNALLSLHFGNVSGAEPGMIALDELALVHMKPLPAPLRPERHDQLPVGVGNMPHFGTQMPALIGEQFKYGWDWDGDGTVDEWTELAPSGRPDARFHIWTVPGNYEVRVKIRTAIGRESPWSPPLPVEVDDDPLFEGFEGKYEVVAYGMGDARVSATTIEAPSGRALQITPPSAETTYWGCLISANTANRGDWTIYQAAKVTVRSRDPGRIGIMLVEYGTSTGADGEMWLHLTEAPTEWTTVTVPFGQLRKHPDYQPETADNNGHLNLEKIRSFKIEVYGGTAEGIAVDEIRLVPIPLEKRTAAILTAGASGRDKALLEDFESVDDVWSFANEGATVFIDATPGENGFAAVISYRSKKRSWGIMKGGLHLNSGDWSGYSALEFQIKGTRGCDLVIGVMEKGAKDPNQDGEFWNASLPVTNEWKTATVSFSALAKDAFHVSAQSDNNNRLDLNRVKDLRLTGIGGGTFYLDEMYLIKAAPEPATTVAPKEGS